MCVRWFWFEFLFDISNKKSLAIPITNENCNLIYSPPRSVEWAYHDYPDLVWRNATKSQKTFTKIQAKYEPCMLASNQTNEKTSQTNKTFNTQLSLCAEHLIDLAINPKWEPIKYVCIQLFVSSHTHTYKTLCFVSIVAGKERKKIVEKNWVTKKKN